MVILGEAARWQPSEIMNMPSARRMRLADVFRLRLQKAAEPPPPQNAGQMAFNFNPQGKARGKG